MIFFKKIFILLRVTQWAKAVFVLLGIIYSHATGYWTQALVAAFSFCLISSSVYIYNDLQDIEEDKLHPRKYRRPLASAQVSVVFALCTLSILLIIGLSLGLAVSSKLAAILGVYLLINLAYNHGLRNVPIFDVLCVTSGFMLRVFAGTIGIGLPITWWLTLTATLLCLFIALNKRRLEMQLSVLTSRRTVLNKYHPKLLDALILVTAMSTFVAYFLYVTYPRNESFYFLLTVPFAAFGLGRFMILSSKWKSYNNDDPIALFLSDPLSRINFLCFFILTIIALGK